MTGAVLAHGIGGRQDLPTPLSMTLWGAVVALVVSFVVLASTWRTSRFQGAQAGIPVPWGVQVVLDAPALRWALRVFGLAAAVYVTVAAVAGPDLAINPTAGVVYA